MPSTNATTATASINSIITASHSWMNLIYKNQSISPKTNTVLNKALHGLRNDNELQWCQWNNDDDDNVI